MQQSPTAATASKHLVDKALIRRLASGEKLTEAEIAKIAGCAPSTAHYAIQTVEIKREVIAHWKSIEADAWSDLARRMIGSIEETEIRKMSVGQRVWAAGVATDKERLIRGQSTANVSVRVLVGELGNLKREIEALQCE